MKPEFSEYNFKQLLEEKSFVSWVLHEDNNKEWKKFIRTNPKIKHQIKKAREIINLLQEEYETLDEKSVIEVWNNINYLQQKQSKVRKTNFPKTIGWAATFLLVFVSSFFAFYYFNSEKNYQFASSGISQHSDARLTLSTGEKIALKKHNSIISLNDTTGQITVNDTIINLQQIQETNVKKVQMNEVIVPYGKKSELLLADGTKVWLNAGSKLAFPSRFTQNKREVFLEGEACFQVAKNEQQPFIVNTENIRVKVLGTCFNVSAYTSDATVETVLIEGSVAVEKSGTLGFGKKEVVLEPNQKASFKKGESEIAVSFEKDTDLYIAWTYGWLKYDRENLLSVLQKVERYFNVEIQLPQDYPADDKITGKLDLKDSLEDVMFALAHAAEFEFRITGNKILIDKKIKEIKRR